MFKSLFLFALITLSLSGCKTTSEKVERDCTNAGFGRGSSAYAQCYATEVQSRRAAARRMLGVSLGMMNQQPTIYKPPNHSIQDSSDTIQNRSYRFGNRTYHCTTVVGHTNCQ